MQTCFLECALGILSSGYKRLTPRVFYILTFSIPAHLYNVPVHVQHEFGNPQLEIFERDNTPQRQSQINNIAFINRAYELKRGNLI